MTIGEKTDPELMGCQAADWIAYGVMQHMCGLLGRELGPTQVRVMSRILKSRIHGVMFMGPKNAPGLYRRFIKSWVAWRKGLKAGNTTPAQSPLLQLLPEEWC